MALKPQRGLDFVIVSTDDDTAGDITIGVENDNVGFYGTSPVAQPADALQAAPAAYATGAFGLDSDVKAEAFYDLVVQMRSTLVNAGLMKGAA